MPPAVPDIPVPRTMRLADGRTLSWIEVGDPVGAPVVSHHGGLSSGWDVAAADATATELGLRIVSPDRPGVGGSDRRPGRALTDWAGDVVQLLDRLGIDRAGALGWSLGGGYAAATARCCPDRVSTLVLVAGTIPAEWEGTGAEGMRTGINRMDRRFMRWSRHRAGRAAERVVFRAMAVAARRRPALVARSAHLGDAARGALPAAMAHGLSPPGGAVDDYRVLDSPWGFDPAEITVPTHIWQGDADDLVPVAWARRLAAAIPGSVLTVVPGATHFLWYERWAEILAPFPAAAATPWGDRQASERQPRT